LDHLAGLAPEDFLTMRLYLNQDAGNVLWEYAFEHLVLGTQLAEYDPSTGETLYVSADDPRVPLEAMLIGYAGRENKDPVRVQWQADGGASLATTIDIDEEYGIFTNELTMPPNRGAVSNVSVELLDSSGTKVTLPPVEVIAGAPATISADQPALTVSAAGVDETTLTVTVTDQHGNPVEANTGVSFFVEGSLHTVETSGATDDNGNAILTLKGGDVAENANVRVTAGDATANVPVTVQPLNVEFVGLDATIFAGKTDSFTVRVTDYQGNPVPDASVTLGSNYGFLSQTEVITDGSGEASATVTTPGSSGSGQVTAQIGRSAWHKTPFEVVYPQIELRDLEVNNAMMVGDTDTSGTLNHVRYDNAVISLPYKVSETIQALGDPGDTVTVNIGDIRDPNVAPIAAYYMNAVDDGQVLDETGRYHLTAESVSQARGTPMGGGRSLRFKPEDPAVQGSSTSTLWATNVPALGKRNNLGFSLDLKPINAGGTLVNLSNGAQTLTQSSTGRLTYKIRTTNGTYQVDSDPLANNLWHKVAARYHNGQIELWVNGNTYTQAASGDLVHNTAASRQLEVGKGFEGQLNSLKWFDWTSQPVMTFDDGRIQKTVTVGPDGHTDMTLRSTGRMSAGGSDLMTQRIAVHTNQVRQYASLVSQDAFATLAGQYADTLDSSAPPINVAGLDPNYQPVSLPFISQAHASDGESSFVWGLVNWFIPIEDFGIVLEQLGYLVSDPEKFDGVEFTIALVNTVTIFPPAKPLKLFTTPLRAMFRKLDKVNPKFAKHFAGYLGKAVQKAKKGDFDTLWNTLPFMVLAAQLYTDEEAREGLEFLFSTVDSADDVVSWVDYLGLPANGWEGEGEPPTVPAFDEDPQVSQQLPLSWLMSQAQAAPIKPSRVAAGFLGDVLTTVAKRVGPNEIKNVPDALRVIKNQLRVTNFKELRSKVFSKDFLKSAVWIQTAAGGRALQNFIRGKSNARYNPFVIMGTMAYLGWESSCGILLENESAPQDPQNGDPQTDPEEDVLTSGDLGCKDKGFRDPDIRDQIAKKIAAVFASSLDRKLEEEKISSNSLQSVGGIGHGELFHLVQVAEYQLLHRAAGGLPIKGLEKSRWVGVFADEDFVPGEGSPLDCSKKQNCLFKRLRRVDIVLGEKGEGKGETWIELKSWSAQSEKGEGRGKLEQARRKPLAHWSSMNARGSTAFHRQFSLDRGANKIELAWLTKAESGKQVFSARVPVDEFYWYFQAFKIKNKKTNTLEVSPFLRNYRQKGSIRYFLAERPLKEGGKEYTEASLTTFSENPSIARQARLKTPKEVVKQLAENGFGDVLESLELDYSGLEE
ncbi:MAG: hypothetical protein COA80_02905, partial [Leeuwenhoekiella sp.]